MLSSEVKCSCLANAWSRLSKLPLAQSTWLSKEAGQSETHQSCLAFTLLLSFLSKTDVPPAPVGLLFACYMYSLFREINIHPVLFGVHRYPGMAGHSIHAFFLFFIYCVSILPKLSLGNTYMCTVTLCMIASHQEMTGRCCHIHSSLTCP